MNLMMMMMTVSSLFLTLLLLFLSSTPLTNAAGGQWHLLQSNIGIVSMHMQLLRNDRVVIYDRTDFGPSNISLPNGKCRVDQQDTALKTDCTAHSVEYNIARNSIRPLTVQTDVWCSSGVVMPNGTLIQTGGYNDGERRARVFIPCGDCDWVEINNGLAVRRWYPTNHILPDGRQIIIGGRAQFNYEFYPKTTSTNQAFSLPFLSQTNDKNVENNLYPFVFLNVDGNLFIFANNRAVLFDYVNSRVVRSYPEIPGGDPRNYPSTGSAVLLPLRNLQSTSIEAEVLVCGGAPKGSYAQAQKGTFVGALNTCGRIKITDPNPKWVVETMPEKRVMSDMILLPNGNVLIINGALSGSAGWEMGRNPALRPIIYRPNNAPGARFEFQNPTTIPRMYHSTAVLIRDGRVLVAGSNPHALYRFSGVLFPTELRMEAFSPSYLDAQFQNLRPTISFPASNTKLGYRTNVNVQFSVTGKVALDKVTVTLVAPPFNTHSFSMSQRLLIIGGDKVSSLRNSRYQVVATIPGSGNLLPSGYYLLFVVHQEIPSIGTWVQIK